MSGSCVGVSVVRAFPRHAHAELVEAAWPALGILECGYDPYALDITIL